MLRYLRACLCIRCLRAKASYAVWRCPLSLVPKVCLLYLWRKRGNPQGKSGIYTFRIYTPIRTRTRTHRILSFSSLVAEESPQVVASVYGFAVRILFAFLCPPYYPYELAACSLLITFYMFVLLPVRLRCFLWFLFDVFFFFLLHMICAWCTRAVS